MRTIAGYIKPYTARLILQLFIKFSATILELLLPMMLSTILDDFVPAGNTQKIWLWGGLMIVCAALAFAGNAINNRMSTRVSADITRKVRYDLFSKVTRLSCAQVDGYSAPSLISRLTSDTYNLHQFIDRMQRLGVRAPILLIGGIIVTFTMEPVLTLVLLATLPILAIVVVTVSKKGVPLYTKTQEALDGLVRKVQENMTGVRVIKALSKTEHEKLQFDAANREVTDTERKAGLLMAVTGPVMNILLNFGLTGVIVVGAYRVYTGVTGSGTIIAFLSYFTIILMALMMVTRMFIMITKGTASANRIEEVLLSPEDMPLRVDEPTDPETAQTNGTESVTSLYHIEFRNVSFSYNKVAFDVEDIDFAIRRGETLGIIGPTGSGKSTLLMLLLRFYDADRGEIFIDGRNVKSIPEAELHSMFGVVFQNDFLFADSIRANIDFMRGIDNEAIETASRDAQAAFITEREGGFDAKLTVKGANLSGGQKQRLLIARALAAENEILLLDDCSSALDYKTDSQLRAVLSRKRAGTSTVIVAQRISSIMNADTILVLDEGKVVGSGTHAELLMSCESYRDIYRVQMGEAV